MCTVGFIRVMWVSRRVSMFMGQHVGSGVHACGSAMPRSTCRVPPMMNRMLLK